jgi:hypothetical protein
VAPTPHTLIHNRYVTGSVQDGATGLAFETFDLQERMPVALRAVPLAAGDEESSENLTSRALFEQAAARLLCLRHPNLPAVLDAFVDGEHGFLVSEPIAGDSLAARVQRGEQFSGEQVAQWADQLLDALDYLHTLEPPIVHTQIDLSELVPQPDGQIKLLGGKLIDQEQAADPRDDLAALVTILYRLVTGEMPPAWEQRRQAVAAGKRDPLAPARRRNPAVPAALSYTLQQALSLQIVERPDSAAEMRGLLAQDPPLEIVVAPEPAARRWWPLAALGGVFALVLVAALMLAVLRPGPKPPVPPASPEPTAVATVLIRPTFIATAVAQVGTSTQPVVSSPTAIQIDTPTPSIVPSPTEIVPTPAPLTIAAIQPAELSTGIVPAQITLTGANLDQVSSARLFSQGRMPIDLAIATQAPDQLILTIAGFPEAVTGEVAYQLELNGQPVQQSITLHDFIAVATVEGVRLNYIYTGRVAPRAGAAVTGMRVDADADSARIGQLENGDQVQILQNAPAGWYQVRVVQSKNAGTQSKVGWIEQWLVDDKNVPPQKFVGRIYSTPTDKAVPCGTKFESSIYGRVENVLGNAIGGATLRVVSSDGLHRYTAKTIADGMYAVSGLGCTTWIVTLVDVPNRQLSFSANQVTVRTLNGAKLTAAEVRFKIQIGP